MNIENQDTSGRFFISQDLGDIKAADSDLSGWRILDSSVGSLILTDCRFNYGSRPVGRACAFERFQFL